jgi:hypothetical protein
LLQSIDLANIRGASFAVLLLELLENYPLQNVIGRAALYSLNVTLVRKFDVGQRGEEGLQLRHDVRFINPRFLPSDERELPINVGSNSKLPTIWSRSKSADRG